MSTRPMPGSRGVRDDEHDHDLEDDDVTDVADDDVDDAVADDEVLDGPDVVESNTEDDDENATTSVTDGVPRWSPPERSDDHLTYDCSDWAGESRALLDAMLSSADIRHTWLGTVLEVPTDEEDRVDAVIDEVMNAAQ